ncbi:hypothetical protein OCL06_04355 [Alteromonas sp. ASW11-19]|uniref:Uncharacterized protein n=1 Tax=Alteromonas salexigens TaxID=2982530 RepID=A0ABT2VKK8_9ALTE|nr:hypothetical protein [Alteromonas salexigens]MCU7553825.1 hypothetical protein [Alteromonas salexigens]
MLQWIRRFWQRRQEAQARAYRRAAIEQSNNVVDFCEHLAAKRNAEPRYDPVSLTSCGLLRKRPYAPPNDSTDNQQ